MCSTRSVTPEASGVRSSFFSSSPHFAGGCKDPDAERISTPKSVRVFAQVRDVDHQAEWTHLEHTIDLTSQVLKERSRRSEGGVIVQELNAIQDGICRLGARGSGGGNTAAQHRFWRR